MGRGARHIYTHALVIRITSVLLIASLFVCVLVFCHMVPQNSWAGSLGSSLTADDPSVVLNASEGSQEDSDGAAGGSSVASLLQNGEEDDEALLALTETSESYTWTFYQNWLGYDASSGSYPLCNYYIYRYVDTSQLNSSGVSAVGGAGGYTRMSTNFSMSTPGTATSTYTLDRSVPSSYLADGVTSLEYTYVLCEFSIDASGTWATTASLASESGESTSLTRLTAESTTPPALYLSSSFAPVTSTATGATLATRAFVLSDSGTVTVTNASGYLATKSWSDGASAHASGEVTLNIYKVESASGVTITNKLTVSRSTDAATVISSLNNSANVSWLSKPENKSAIISLLNKSTNPVVTLVNTVTLNEANSWQESLGDLSPTKTSVSYDTYTYYVQTTSASGATAYDPYNYTVSATSTTTYYIEEVSQIGYTTSYAQGTTPLTPTTITYLDGSSSTTVNAAPVVSADSAGNEITIANAVDTNTSDSTITITNKLVDENGNAITNDNVAFSFSISSIDPLDDTTRENSQVWGFRYIDAGGVLHDVLNGGDKEYAGTSFAFANVTIPAGKSITIISLLLDVDGDGLYDATCEMGSYYIYELTGEYMPTKAGYSYAGKSVEQTLYPDGAYSDTEYQTFSADYTLASGDAQTITFTNMRTKLEEATIEIVKYLDGTLVQASTDYTFTLYKRTIDSATNSATYTAIGSTSSIANGLATIVTRFNPSAGAVYFLAETGYPSGMANPDTTVWEVQIEASYFDDAGNSLTEPEVHLTYAPSVSVTIDQLTAASGGSSSTYVSPDFDIEVFDKAAFSNATEYTREFTITKQVSAGGDGMEVFDFYIELHPLISVGLATRQRILVVGVSGSPIYYTIDEETGEYTAYGGRLTPGTIITASEDDVISIFVLVRMKKDESVTFRLMDDLTKATNGADCFVWEAGCYDTATGVYDSDWSIESVQVNGAAYTVYGDPGNDCHIHWDFYSYRKYALVFTNSNSDSEPVVPTGVSAGAILPLVVVAATASVFLAAYLTYRRLRFRKPTFGERI